MCTHPFLDCAAFLVTALLASHVASNTKHETHVFKRATFGHTQRVIRLLAVVAAMLTLAAIGVAAAGTAESTRAARLSLMSVSPLTLRGTSFQARERVRVRVVTDFTTRTRRVSAGPAGRLVVRFADVSVHRCSTLFAEAVGSEGSLARFKRPQPLCPPN